MIDTTDDLILLLTACAATFTGAMAAIRLSKCVKIDLCWGCLKLERKVKGPDPPSPDASVQV
jgi:hypothetical protein